MPGLPSAASRYEIQTQMRKDEALQMLVLGSEKAGTSCRTATDPFASCDDGLSLLHVHVCELPHGAYQFLQHVWKGHQRVLSVRVKR